MTQVQVLEGAFGSFPSQLNLGRDCFLFVRYLSGVQMTLMSYSFKIHFNIVFPYGSRSPKLSPHFRTFD
jgi:hypothetical protein